VEALHEAFKDLRKDASAGVDRVHVYGIRDGSSEESGTAS
jgi:hypothetical protein